MVHVYRGNYFDPEVMTAVFVQAIGRYTVLTLRDIGAQNHTRVQLTELTKMYLISVKLSAVTRV